MKAEHVLITDIIHTDAESIFFLLISLPFTGEPALIRCARKVYSLLMDVQYQLSRVH